jgi:hypothetical protein
MFVRIAIRGASGAVGSTVALHILRSGLLEPQDRLVLVGHGTSSIERGLMPARVDLLDAFDDERLQISINQDIDEIETDLPSADVNRPASDRLVAAHWITTVMLSVSLPKRIGRVCREMRHRSSCLRGFDSKALSSSPGPCRSSALANSQGAESYCNS